MRQSRAEQMDEARWIVWNQVKPSYSIQQLKEIMKLKWEEFRAEQKLVGEQIENFEVELWWCKIQMRRLSTPIGLQYWNTWNTAFYDLHSTSYSNVEKSYTIYLEPYKFWGLNDWERITFTDDEKKYINSYPDNLIKKLKESIPKWIVEDIKKQIKKEKNDIKFDEWFSSIVKDYIAIFPLEKPALKWTPMTQEDIEETIRELDTWKSTWRNSLYNISNTDESKKEIIKENCEKNGKECTEESGKEKRI